MGTYTAYAHERHRSHVWQGRDGTGLGEKVNSVYPWSTSPVSPIDKERTDAARRTTDDKEGREGKAANEFRVNGLAISLIQSGMSMSATSTSTMRGREGASERAREVFVTS